MSTTQKAFHIIINKRSGTTGRLGEDKVSALLETHLDGKIAQIEFIEPNQCGDYLKKLRDGKDKNHGGGASRTCRARRGAVGNGR